LLPFEFFQYNVDKSLILKIQKRCLPEAQKCPHRKKTVASEMRIDSVSGDDTNTYYKRKGHKDFKGREKALLKKRRRISAKYYIKPCY
jgi:hypothetical protein